MGIGDRPTVEVVVLIVTTVVGATVVLAGVGVFVIAIVRPEINQSATITALGQVLDILVGLLVGYLAGKTPVVSALKTARKPPGDDEP